ncbi:MAG TPA: glutathione transferase GstA [Burkholderiales bacterium]|nr:glutathione transferase GstA [Burkholderiales bacterium]
MKLYYYPGACSMAPHIVLREAGYKFELEKVNLSAMKTASGEDFWKVNPKGYVPALKLDDGQILSEAAVILQYLADQKPNSGLAPKAGTMERYRLMEWLNFIASEIHKSVGAFFHPQKAPEWKEKQLALVGKRFDYLESALDGKKYLTGDNFSVADAYLFTVLSWTRYHKIDISKWPKLKDYLASIIDRPAVRESMKAEGLLK